MRNHVVIEQLEIGLAELAIAVPPYAALGERVDDDMLVLRAAAGMHAGLGAEGAALHERTFAISDRVLHQDGVGQIPMSAGEIPETELIGTVRTVPHTRFHHLKPPLWPLAAAASRLLLRRFDWPFLVAVSCRLFFGRFGFSWPIWGCPSGLPIAVPVAFGTSTHFGRNTPSAGNSVVTNNLALGLLRGRSRATIRGPAAHAHARRAAASGRGAAHCIVTKTKPQAERRLWLLSCCPQVRLLGWRQGRSGIGCRSAKYDTRRPIAHVLAITKNTNLMPQSCLLLRSYRFDGAFLPKCVRAIERRWRLDLR